MTPTEHHGAQLDFSKDMSYGDYLQLDAILSAQKPLSPDHNEMLFIVQHQTSELWMKLMLHELHAAVAHVAEDRLPEAFKMLARVSRIMEQLVHAWDVLATMTPPEYSAIRPYLAKSSGFQSAQYRRIEFMLGNKNAAMLKPHEHRADLLAQVQAAYQAPSLYDEVLQLMARRGIDVPASHTARDWTQPYAADEGVKAAWLTVYRAPQAHWDLYQMGEELVDLEDAFRLPPRDDRGARHRLQARHRRHGWRELPAQDAGRRAVPGTVGAAHRALMSRGRLRPA
jgi:tryptophan 2,3-dioxygenase